MKRVLYPMAAAALLIPLALFARDKSKKKTVPAVFGNAQYVYVQAEDGDIYKPGLLPEDRQAISDVIDALREWNRYTITARREEAQLVFYVRKGRVASTKLGGTIGTPNQGPYPGQPRGGGVMAGGEAGPPDDLLEVRMQSSGGDLSSPIWFRTQPDGLNAPRVPLLAQLKDAVEKDYPK